MGNAPCLMNTLDGVPRGGRGAVWLPRRLPARLAHPRRQGAQVLQLAVGLGAQVHQVGRAVAVDGEGAAVGILPARVVAPGLVEALPAQRGKGGLSWTAGAWMKMSEFGEPNR